MNHEPLADTTVDLNADAGEGFDSEELFAALTTASIACGGHVGDDASMRAALALARGCGVAVGAHPGYADTDNFGRVETGEPPAAAGAYVERQTARLADLAAAAGLRLSHVKPHGALYHRANADPGAARAIVAAIRRLDAGLAVVGFPGSALLAAAAAEGLLAIPEGFADRRYGADGTLVPRPAANALLAGEEAVGQALALAAGTLPNASFRRPVRSLCLHSDSPGAAALARAVRRALEGAGASVGAFAPAARVPAIPEVRVVGAAIVEAGRVLLTRRSERMSMPGKWEFPGGKLEPGETPRDALAREVAEELGVKVEIGARLGRGTGLHAGRRIVLEVFLARRTAGELALAEHEEHGWFGPAELVALDWPEADLPILPALERALAALR